MRTRYHINSEKEKYGKTNKQQNKSEARRRGTTTQALRTKWTTQCLSTVRNALRASSHLALSPLSRLMLSLLIVTSWAVTEMLRYNNNNKNEEKNTKKTTS